MLQEGNESHTTALKHHLTKNKNNQTIWGSASYQNTQLKNIQWNNNLDLIALVRWYLLIRLVAKQTYKPIILPEDTIKVSPNLVGVRK